MSVVNGRGQKGRANQVFGACGQPPRVDMARTYERIICVVPMIGKGTPADPRRPMFAPLPSAGRPAPNGIIGFAFQPADDANFAIVQLVARDRTAFGGILADGSVKTFERGKPKAADLEAEIQRFKKNFKLDKLEVRVP
jgi:hypothetical protein